MAQPSGQLSLKTANASEFFYYAQGTNGLWDARNGALLSKTGTAGMATEGGAQVVLGDAATQYNLPAAINITGGAWTVIFRARITSGAGTNSMVAGDATGTADFFWLSNGSGECAMRVFNANYSFANSGNTTLATYAWVYAGNQLKLYKNGSLLNTFTGVPSGAALKISAILAGYSGGSFRLNGALEFLNAIPSALSDAEIASRTSDPYAVLEVGATDATAPGATLAGTSSLSVGSATGGAVVDGTATGTTLAGTSSLSAGAASGGTSGSFTTDAMENNTGAGLLANTAVSWTWYQGSIGAAPTSTTHGTGTTNASGVLTVSGLPTGAGFLLVSTTDSSGVYYQPGTVT